MTSVQKQQPPQLNDNNNNKAKASQTQQVPKSPSTALTNNSNSFQDRYLYSKPTDVHTSPYRSSVITSSPNLHHHHSHLHHAVPAHSTSAGYVQYQPPSYEVVETHTAHREREVTVEVPQYRTYVHYQPEAYEVTETHTAQREKEVTVEVPQYRTYVHYQPETYEVTETHLAEREKEVTVEIPIYTTYHTHKPEAYEIIETHTAYKEKEVTVEVPTYKEVTYCTPEKREIVQDWIAPKEHVVYNPVQHVSYRLVPGFKAKGEVVKSSPVTIVNSPPEFLTMSHSSPVKKNVTVERVKTAPRPVEVVEVERCHACGQTVPGKCQYCGQRRSSKEGEKKSQVPRKAIEEEEDEEEEDQNNSRTKKVGKRRERLDDRKNKKNTN